MAALYSDTILEHFRRPRNRGRLDAPDLADEGVNPLCGDRIRIELKVDDGRVSAARFVGDACAISVAAASILTERLHGLPVSDVATIDDQTLLDALGADITPGRRQCALLPLTVLRTAIARRAP